MHTHTHTHTHTHILSHTHTCMKLCTSCNLNFTVFVFVSMLQIQTILACVEGLKKLHQCDLILFILFGPRLQSLAFQCFQIVSPVAYCAFLLVGMIKLLFHEHNLLEASKFILNHLSEDKYCLTALWSMFLNPPTHGLLYLTSSTPPPPLSIQQGTTTMV